MRTAYQRTIRELRRFLDGIDKNPMIQVTRRGNYSNPFELLAEWRSKQDIKMAAEEYDKIITKASMLMKYPIEWH